MSASSSGRPRSKLPIVVLVLVIVIAALVGGGLFLRPRFESEPPQIVVSPNVDVVGVAPMEIQVADKGTGLKSVTATLSQGGTEQNLATEQFAQPVGEKKIAVALAKVPGVKEGPAVLRVTARDASLLAAATRPWCRRTSRSTLTPPTLELIADDRYVNFGGVGAIVYKASADTATSGVQDRRATSFPVSPARSRTSPDHILALFAHPYDAPPEAKAHAGRHRQGRQHARDAACLRAEERAVQEEHHRGLGQLPAEQGGAAAHRRRPRGRARRRTCSSP